jgi:hypothetical protein
MKELRQRRNLEKRNFYILDDTLKVEYLSLRKQSKFDLELDKIGFKTNYQSDNTLPGKIMFFIFTILPILYTIGVLISDEKVKIPELGMIWFFCILLNTFNLLKNHQDDIILTGLGSDIYFYRTKPSEKEVKQFIDDIIKISKEYKKTKYAKYNPLISEEQYDSNLLWLKQQKVIDEIEMLDLKEDYRIKKLL